MDVYALITERIIEKLEAGTIPWHKPWRSVGAPRNLVSKKTYSGINVWLLTAQGFTSPYWRMRQINELGGHVCKGEKSTPLVFWRIYMDGVEVEANGDQHEPEHEQQEQRGRRRFVCAITECSIPNNANCRQPSPRSWRFLRKGPLTRSRPARRCLLWSNLSKGGQPRNLGPA
jgi:antirestriction protein ArdC